MFISLPVLFLIILAIAAIVDDSSFEKEASDYDGDYDEYNVID